MKQTSLLLYGFLFIFTGSISLQAQTKETYWGKLHGGVDANAAFYKKDKDRPDLDTLGLNTYINLNYEYKKFNVGLQYELYEPPMRGYPKELKGHKLMQYFAGYSGNNLSMTLGSFYEQFGSGLIFRSYEERALGVNTSLRGMHIKYSPLDWMTFKALAGQPRRYLEYADAITYGADGDFIISRLWNKEYTYNVTFGSSWIMRHNQKTYDAAVEPTTVNLFGVRTGFNNAHINIGLEYTSKGLSQSFSPITGEYVNQRGDALLLNMDYTREGLGISGVFRRIEHMDFRVDNKPAQIYIPLNYIPALTKQHKYALPSLYPHVANPEGEIGGQMDIFWDVAPEWMGKYPMKFSLNASWYRSLGDNWMKTMPFWGKEGINLFRETSLELGKRLNRNVKTNIGFYFQEKYESGKGNYKSFIEVIDVLWRINRKISLRSELQHMNTEMRDKAWLYGLIEFGLAPHWMVYVSDMHNYGADEKEHFFNIGAGYVHNSLRVSVTYGKNREGLQCVGGVCRFVPGYTGATFTLSYVF